MDARYFSGPAYLIVGSLVLVIGLRLWLVHPINRVFRIGPFVTERGMVAVLAMRSLFASFGAMMLSSGLVKTCYWYFIPIVNAPVNRFLGSLEAGMSLWAATMACIAAYRLYRIK